MIRTLKALIGIHQKGDATAAEIEAALIGARAEIEAAERAHAEAGTAYTAGLLRLEEDELHQLIADKDAATVRRDRAIALVEALTGRLAAAQASAVQAERTAAYDAAARAQAAAAKVLAAEYPKLARALVEVLRTVAAADALAEIANGALPDGVEALPSVEGRVRREANVPERIARSEEFTVWCRENGDRLHPDDQAQVRPNPDQRTGTFKAVGYEPVQVELRRFRRVTRVPEAFGRSVPTLAASVNLPGLRASHTAFWSADTARNPAAIVAAISAAALEWGKATGPTVLFEPDPTVEVIDLDAPVAAAA